MPTAAKPCRVESVSNAMKSRTVSRKKRLPTTAKELDRRLLGEVDDLPRVEIVGDGV